MSSIALVNKSTLVSDADVALIAQAIDTQVREHFAPTWGIAPWAVRFYPAGVEIPPDAAEVHILDDAGVAGALGYHDEAAADMPEGFVFARVEGEVLPSLMSSGGLWYPTVSSVCSHEILELIGDPDANVWVDGPKIGAGRCYALEACDPVQTGSYEIGVKDADGTTRSVAVSNFVFGASEAGAYASWFDPDGPSGSRYDWLGVLTAPFSIAQGGYMLVRNSPGTETQVLGRTANPKRPGSRTPRRLGER